MSTASELERYMRDLINAERAERGLAPLQLERNLNAAAEGHSRWMLATDTFRHAPGRDGTTASERMEQAGFDFSGRWRSGENIAWQTERGAPGLRDDVADLHAALMDSDGHRANILQPAFEVVGLGIEVGEFTFATGSAQSVMITQNFAATDGVLALDTPDAPAVDVPGTDSGEVLTGTRANDRFLPGLGADTIELAGGGDVVEGDAAALDGDRLIGFGVGDAIVLDGQRLGPAEIAFDAAAGTLTLAGATLLFGDHGPGEGGFLGVRTLADGGATQVRFMDLIPERADGRALADDAVNGLRDAGFLSGDNATAFEVTIEARQAAYDNFVGFFVTEGAAIVRTGTLFASAHDARPDAPAIVEGLRAGQALEFFIVQDGADRVAALDGALGLARDGDGDLILTADGVAVADAVVFASRDAAENPDGVEHFVSGPGADGRSLRVGIEDLTGGGDRDYEDVSFRVTALTDDLIL